MEKQTEPTCCPDADDKRSGTKGGTALRSGAAAEAAYKKFLSLGFRIAPTADQDNHTANWGNATNARTVIIAPKLTRSALLQAIRDRHVYATEDKNLSILIRINGHLCGDVVSPVEGEAQIDFSISDPDEPDASYEIEVWRGTIGPKPAKVVTTISTGALNGKIEDVALSGSPEFFFFKIKQTSQVGDDEQVDEAWTSPVWFDNVQDLTVNTLATNESDESVASSVASKNSKIYHSSDLCFDAKKIKPTNRVTGTEARKGRVLHEDCPRTKPN